jgi:DNA-binding GntR family transcriptional regulator
MKTAERRGTVTPASKRATSREIQERIAGAIGDGEFLPGTPLVEAALATKFGVSRVPVREALRALEQDGLVVHVPRKGRFVAPLSTQDVEEVFFLREVLEIAAARLSYDRVSDEELDELSDLLDALTPDLSPRQDYFVADASVHDAIARKAGNRRLLAMLQLLNSQIERARRTSAMQQNRLSTSVKEHKDIVQALKMRDLPLVEARLRAHLHNVKEATMEVCRTLLRD